MTLSKQTKACRENTKKSTGPKTAEGKAISSQNATTFGLYSRKLVINSKTHTEDRVDYELLIEDLRTELNPKSFFQEYLIKKIANCLWRSQRAVFAETAHINKQLNNLDDKIDTENFIHKYKMKNDENLEPLDFTSTDTNEYSNLIGVNAIPDKNFATRILHYEMRIDKQLARTYSLLRSLQRKESQLKTEREKEEKNRKALSNNEPISF